MDISSPREHFQYLARLVLMGVGTDTFEWMHCAEHAVLPHTPTLVESSHLYLSVVNLLQVNEPKNNILSRN